MKRQQVASFNVTLDPWQSRSSPKERGHSAVGGILGGLRLLLLSTETQL